MVSTSSRAEVGRRHLGLALGSFVLEHLRLRVGRGVAGHVELHADLVELERRKLARDVRARLAVQHVDVLVERLAGRHGDRVPEVVVVVALVVVADAGMLADDRGGVVDAIGVDLGGDECRRVPERPRVEDRRQLAQHAEVLDLCTRARTAGSSTPSRSASTANGRGSSGKSHCTAFSSSRSRSSSRSPSVTPHGRAPSRPTCTQPLTNQPLVAPSTACIFSVGLAPVDLEIDPASRVRAAHERRHLVDRRRSRGRSTASTMSPALESRRSRPAPWPRPSRPSGPRRRRPRRDRRSVFDASRRRADRCAIETASLIGTAYVVGAASTRPSTIADDRSRSVDQDAARRRRGSRPRWSRGARPRSEPGCRRRCVARRHDAVAHPRRASRPPPAPPGPRPACPGPGGCRRAARRARMRRRAARAARDR